MVDIRNEDTSKETQADSFHAAHPVHTSNHSDSQCVLVKAEVTHRGTVVISLFLSYDFFLRPLTSAPSSWWPFLSCTSVTVCLHLFLPLSLFLEIVCIVWVVPLFLFSRVSSHCVCMFTCSLHRAPCVSLILEEIRCQWVYSTYQTHTWYQPQIYSSRVKAHSRTL